MKYIIDLNLDQIGLNVVKKHHPDLADLQIGFMFRDEAPKSSTGEVLFAQAIPVDGRNWLLHKKDVIIMVCQDLWNELDDQQKIILMDHELCHVGVRKDENGAVVLDEDSGRPKVYLRSHDIQEFEIIMTRYAAQYKAFKDRTREIANIKSGTKEGIAKA